MSFLAVAVVSVSTGVSIDQNKRARRQTARGQEADNKRRKLQNRKSIQEQLRQAQVTAASITAAGAEGNVQDSSAVQGGLNSIVSQSTGNIAFAQQIAALQQESFERLQSADRAVGRGQTAAGVAQIAGSFVGKTGSESPKTLSTNGVVPN